jgi:hypothetical protein
MASLATTTLSSPLTAQRFLHLDSIAKRCRDIGLLIPAMSNAAVDSEEYNGTYGNSLLIHKQSN